MGSIFFIAEFIIGSQTRLCDRKIVAVGYVGIFSNNSALLTAILRIKVCNSCEYKNIGMGILSYMYNMLYVVHIFKDRWTGLDILVVIFGVARHVLDMGKHTIR